MFCTLCLRVCFNVDLSLFADYLRETHGITFEHISMTQFFLSLNINLHIKLDWTQFINTNSIEDQSPTGCI